MSGERLRARWTSKEGDPAFLGHDHPAVRRLLDRLAPGSEVRDLGGWTSTNLHLVDQDRVLRIHQRFVTRARIDAVHTVRRRLLDRGLRVAEPLAVEYCAGRVAELETYVPHEPIQGADSGLYEAMGRFHGAARDLTLPRPVDAQYGTPTTLRRWLTDVRGDAETMRVAEWAKGIVRDLRRQWVPASQLPRQLVHGDLNSANLGRTPAGETLYLDFGFAAVRPRIHDLAVALFYLVVGPGDDGLAGDFDWTRVAGLIEAYEQASGVTLTERERRALAPYTAAVPLAVAAPAAYLDDPTYLRYRERQAGMRIAEWILAHPGVVG